MLLLPNAAHARMPATPVEASAAAAAPAKKVTIEVYGMAGCPFTRAFLEGPLFETITIAPELVDLHFHPFGNTYFATKECGGSAAGMPYASYFKGYNATARKCWDELCGAAAQQPVADCFSGDLVCQHGATDGMVTTSWACAKSMAPTAAGSAPPFAVLMRFVQCTASQFLGVVSEAAFRGTVAECAASTGLDARELVACATGPRGQALLRAEARATVRHAGVPYVLVDGLELGDTGCVACGDGIMQKVCEASRRKVGTDAPVCKAVLG